MGMAKTQNHIHATDVAASERLQALLEVVSSYIEHYHGGWVRLVSFDGKVLKVELGGACSSCPLTETTLRVEAV
jgi:Fe-S cluster biogenesis protein NfuA